jgi:hypothetical protein
MVLVLAMTSMGQLFQSSFVYLISGWVSKTKLRGFSPQANYTGRPDGYHSKKNVYT